MKSSKYRLYGIGPWPFMGLSTVACVTLMLPPKADGVTVTFRVAQQEEYKIRLIDPADIAIARQLLNGKAAPGISNGVVVRGDSNVNTGYTRHIDPDSVDFADVTTEVCDGLPSDIEQGIITSEYYCPWAAEVIAIEDVNP